MNYDSGPRENQTVMRLLDLFETLPAVPSLASCAATCMLVLAPISHATDWRLVHSSSSGVTFVDSSTIRRSGDSATAWFLEEAGVAPRGEEWEGIVSTMFLTEFHCPGRQMRLLETADFSGPGGTGELLSELINETEWGLIEEGSAGKVMWEVACVE